MLLIALNLLCAFLLWQCIVMYCRKLIPIYITGLKKVCFQLAVPFFFVTSGFLLGSKMNNITDIKIIKSVFVKYIKRCFKLLIVFEPIAIIFNIPIYYHDTKNIWHCLLLTIRDIVFYPKGALWYILASIVGAWIIYLFFRFNRKKLMIPVAVLLYGFALICNSYFFIIENSAFGQVIKVLIHYISSIRNGIFVGFLLLLVGFLVAERWNNSSLFKNKKRIMFCLLISFCLFLLELYLIKDFNKLDDSSLSIIKPLVVTFLLMFCLCFSSNNVNKTCLHLRHLSTGVYVLHRSILLILTYGIILVFRAKADPVILFVLTLSISIGICLTSYRSKIPFINSILK